MAKIEKRFQLLLSEEEMQMLKSESEKRGISAGELLRMSLRNEITQIDVYERMSALKRLTEIHPE